MMLNHTVAPISTTVLNLQAVVPLIYTIPSLLVYVLVIIVLLRRFKEPFYRLFAVNGVMVGIDRVTATKTNMAIFRNA